MDEINIRPESFIEFWNNKLYKDYLGKHEDVVKDALIKAGFTINEQFLKDNFELIDQQGDRFKHLYYHFGKPDQQRIISIEKEYNIDYSENNGAYKVTMSQQYY